MDVVNNPEDRVGRHAARCRSRASSTSSATTSAKIRRRSSSAWRPAAKCGCATRTSSPARSVVKDDAGEIVELRCTYDPATRGGDAPDGRKVKATLHWVSAAHAVDGEVRLYDRLFTVDEARRRRGARLADDPEPGLARGPDGVQARAVRWPPPPPARASSSSGSATSASIPTRRPARRSSTAPSRSRTPGRRSRHAAKRRASRCPGYPSYPGCPG